MVKRLLYDGLLTGHRAPHHWVIHRASVLAYSDYTGVVADIPPLRKNSYTLTEVGQRWGFYRTRIKHLVASGQLHVKTLRGARRVTREELERWEQQPKE